jgi:hypothetical protein
VHCGGDSRLKPTALCAALAQFTYQGAGGMQFIPVRSRMILGVRYNKRTRDLDVVFQTGGTYRYKRVPPSVYEGLLNADSHGQYMHNTILGKYDYERLASD